MKTDSFRVFGIIFIAGLFLAACATLIQSRVTRFHAFDEINYQGASVIVLPFKEQQNSLEFRQYANVAVEEFSKVGFHPVSDIAAADFAVFFNYAIDKGTTLTTQVPIFGQTGGGLTTYSGSTFGTIGGTTYSGSTFGTAYEAPTFGQIGSMPITNTTYGRVLMINMLSTQSDRSGEYPTVFEARVLSSGLIGEIAVVLPYMIRAALKDFPGESGETTNVTFPVQK